MVNVRGDVPRTPQGNVNIPLWVDKLLEDHDHLDSQRLEAVGGWLSAAHPDLLAVGLELAELVAELNMDLASVIAGLVYRGVREGRYDDAELAAVVGQESAHIAGDVAQLATSSLLEMSNSPLLEKEHQDQVENIKRMLISLINDPRVAVVKLAERVMALRHAKNYDPARRARIAQEASGVFAPLAGRLGIWQLKWELEDLALRYTQEAAYQEIARQLQAKRAEREIQVEHMIDQVRGLLRGHGIDAVVYGRAKHIYSIWRKMQSKGVSFDQVYDVRAVRVVVNNLAECYAALGVIHATWPHIPSEFDDYIANPKENGYQSIHTAVTAADGRTLEIQIRTVAMHEDAELGLCAHWSYKDGVSEDGNFAAKMDWLRQVIEWHEDLGGTASLRSLLAHRVNEERIFVSTPKGHVVELPHGATGLDFAYRVHTDVGHACAGVRVNGVLTPLYRRLETGQQVEVLTEADGEPRRDWLEAGLRYVCSDRARAKLYSYFRHLEPRRQQEIGRDSLTRKLTALGLEQVITQQMGDIAAASGKQDVQALYAAVGSAELSGIDVLVNWLQRHAAGSQLQLPGIETLEFPQTVRLRVVADNRDGLLHDITQVVGDMKLSLSGTTGRVSNPAGSAIITVDVMLSEWLQSVKFVSYLNLLEGVTEIRRISVS
jgi:GTP pyrophosphokinase